MTYREVRKFYGNYGLMIILGLHIKQMQPESAAGFAFRAELHSQLVLMTMGRFGSFDYNLYCPFDHMQVNQFVSSRLPQVLEFLQ